MLPFLKFDMRHRDPILHAPIKGPMYDHKALKQSRFRKVVVCITLKQRMLLISHLLYEVATGQMKINN